MDSEAIEEDFRRACAAGDRDRALTILMESFGRLTYRYCCHLLMDEETAKDVHQQTFISAYKALDTFRGEAALRTWLLGIARHRCLDALRARQRNRSRFGALDDVAEPVAEAERADAPAIANSLTTALRRCLKRLSPKVREAVVLRYVEGFSYPEMASLCEQQPATLQARVTRSLPALRHCLEESGAGL